MGFLAAHGGVGTTTLAVNTAIRLANRGASTVALLDLDPWWGQVATHLDLAPRATISELARDLHGNVDPETGAQLRAAPPQRRVGVHLARRVPTRPRR